MTNQDFGLATLLYCIIFVVIIALVVYSKTKK